ncbi:nitrilase-related carbon-nitrogen hydrolase [Gemmatimonadota bacterium]
MNDLRVVIHQTAPLLGEVEANERALRERVEDSLGAGLVAFSELALTGYSLRSRVQRMASPLSSSSPLSLPTGSPPVAYGLPERGLDQLVYNSAVLVHENRVLLKHRKVYLPTYGLFDEGRYFARGDEPPEVAVLPSGWRVGMLLCEDFWHPGLIYLLAMQRADLVLVLAAAPGRGDPGEDSPPSQALFRSTRAWTLLARSAALQYGLYLVLVNRAGVEEAISFAGGSIVVAPDGDVLAEAPQGEEASLEVALSERALRRARTPYSHMRDEDPAFLRRALDTLSRGE